jgi:hypothetical protein
MPFLTFSRFCPGIFSNGDKIGTDIELTVLLRPNSLSLLDSFAPEIFVRGDLYNHLLLYKVYLFLETIC